MAFDKVVFWIAAHQDDWQILHGNQAYGDMQSAKTVFIYTTAGDGGFDAGYWQAREAGALASVLHVVPRVALDQYAESTPPYLTVTSEQINDHAITKYTCANVSSYFLRLPSGNWGLGYGYDGFPSNQMTTLSKLQAGEIATISAVDGSTTYEGWEDLRETVKAILSAEGEGFEATPWLNTSDFDVIVNPDDHCDHYATGLLTNDLYFLKHYNRALWQGYGIANKNKNLSDEENSKKWEVLVPYGRIFLAYVKLVGLTAPVEFEAEQKILQDTAGWNYRAYFRTIPATG